MELKRRDRAEFRQRLAPLPFPFSSKLRIWTFRVVVEQGRQRNVQKSVMESCLFAY